MEMKEIGADRAGPAEEHPARMPGGRLVRIRVAADQTGGAYSLLEVEVVPGGGERPHIQHREDECLYVVEGRFAFAVEDSETEAGPGAHLYVPKGSQHAYKNTGSGPGRLLVVHTPGGAQESFLAAAGASRGPGRDLEGFALLAAEHGIEICGTAENTERSF